MPRFIYHARDTAGNSDSGVVAARDVDEASRKLRNEGKVIVRLHEEHHATGPYVGGASRKKVGRDEAIFFATQLAIMVDTGVPLTDALDSIAEQTDHEGFQQMIEDISDQVKGGDEFSTALENYPKVFSKLFVALMRASEVSGTMGKMLQRVSEYMHQERETRKAVKGAMAYPAFILSFCLLVVVGLLLFVLPRFEKIYAGKGALLPLPTRALLGFSRMFVSYWPFILVAIAAIAVGLYLYLRSAGGKILLDKIRISIPVLGPMYRKVYLARSLRTMATVVSTGVGMLEGLSLTAEVAGNHFYSRVWTNLADSAREGGVLSDELRRSKLIPPTVAQMVAAGERTGKLDVVMNRVAGFCEEDVKAAVGTMTRLVEPAMIIIMGLIVGGISIALLMPVLSISKIVAH